MSQIKSKSGLAIILSTLEGFPTPKIRHEQYTTDSEVGAFVLWNAYLFGDIEGEVIADLGCGTGILGIGALLLGAKRVFFVDSDKTALKTAKENLLKVKSEGYNLENVEFVCDNVKNLKIKADVVLQNPPFGTKIRNIDTVFLKKALETADIGYSFHKSETKGFLQWFLEKNNAKITHIWDLKFPLKAVFSFHRRKIHRISVSCIRFEKKKVFK